MDGIAVPEGMGMDFALQAAPSGGLLDDLVSPLFCDVGSLPGPEQVVVPTQRPFLGLEKDGAGQTILYVHHPLHAALAIKRMPSLPTYPRYHGVLP